MIDKSLLIRCECGDMAHSLMVDVWHWDKAKHESEIILNYQLDPVGGRWDRFKRLCAYLWRGTKSPWHDTVVKNEDVRALRNFLDCYLRELDR